MDGIARRSTPQLTLIGQPYRYLGYSNNKSTGSPVAMPSPLGTMVSAFTAAIADSWCEQ